MPRNRGILDRQILPGSIGRTVTTTWRGRFIVRAWPKKAGKAKAPALIASQEQFRQAQKLIKLVSGDAMDDAIQIAKGTGLYPRDVLMSAMTVGLYDMATSDGYLMTHAVYYLRPKMFQGAIVQKFSNQSITANVSTAITWDDPILQTVPILFPAQPTRLVVPAQTTVVSLTACVRSVGLVNGIKQLVIANQAGKLIAGTQEQSNQRATLSCSTGPIVVTPGDWFRAIVFFGANAVIDFSAGTHFSMTLEQVTL